MNENVKQYVDHLFKPYEHIKSIAELKHDLLNDLKERYDELRQIGKDEELAAEETIRSIGDMEETLKEMAGQAQTSAKNLQVNFNASALENSDFSNVTLHNGSLKSSTLKNTDFSNSDLTGSSFKTSDLEGAIFHHTDLTNCNFSIVNLRGADFEQSILKNTSFNKSELNGVRFKNMQLIDVNFSMTELKRVKFENCVIDGGNFDMTDLTGQIFDGQFIQNVYMGKACLTDVSFRNATLKNVSFKPPLCITNKYYRIIRTMHFEGAIMDKLTYNALKGLGADVTCATIQ